MVKCRFCHTKSPNAKEPRLSPQLFFSLPDACSARPPVIYIRSPLAYAYAELYAHGARHARPLSFARMEVLRTSQEEQIELSLSLDFLRFAQSKRATAYTAALFAFAEYAFRTCSGLLEHLLLIAVFLLKFVICINGIII